jgi:hypothetical protein
MKRLTYICFLAVFVISACNKKEAISDKVGIRLSPVSNLALQELAEPEVKLTWTNPSDIPAEITQPIKIFIEVREILGVMQSITVLSTTLENAPTEFTYALPDVNKKYMFTVKANGTANIDDVRFSNNVFSLGQTVSYTP